MIEGLNFRTSRERENGCRIVPALFFMVGIFKFNAFRLFPVFIHCPALELFSMCCVILTEPPLWPQMTSICFYGVIKRRGPQCL